MNISEDADERPPPLRLLAREPFALLARMYRAFGRLGPFGPEDGPPVLVIPGFLATDRTTLGLQRALGEAGFRASGTETGINAGARPDTLDRLAKRIEAFGKGRRVTLIGWSLGGIFAREVAKLRPDLVDKVITMGTPISGDPRANNAWRLYELVAGHKVDNPPIETRIADKPPVPTLAIWSRRDGIVAPAAARGKDGERDAELELDCSHMGFATSGAVFPKIVAAAKRFAA
ncbi:MAG: alpha/beta fold hydrolase [Alphaproteobacteria bacterium]|nr:alpha/beta fold hydrolase [Alphaproteobacteria bacterium]